MNRYRDRAEAGRELARHLEAYAARRDAIVLGLARGGMPVAYEVANALALPLDVFLVRKLGVPGQEELAMGAIASGGVRVMNPSVSQALDLPQDVVDAIVAREQRELGRRERDYRDGGAPARVAGLTAILVDDGLATGSSMRAAVEALRQRKAARIVVAVPVAPPAACAELEHDADAVVCPRAPEPFHAVGAWYDDFDEITDDEVRRLLEKARTKSGHSRDQVTGTAA
jgi:putative phosphoribosyl transferase